VSTARLARTSAAAVAIAAVAFVLGAFAVAAAAATAGERGPYAVAAVALAGAMAFAAWRLPGGPLVVFAATLPIGLTPLPGGVVQVGQAAAAGAAAAVLVPAALRRDLGRLRTPHWLWVGLFVLTAAVATPGAVDLTRAIRGDLNLVIGVGLAAAVAYVARDPHGLLALHRALVVVGGATCAASLPSARQTASFGGAVVEGRAVGVFTQPNELGMFAAFVLMLALTLAVRPDTTRRWRVVAVLGAAGAGGALGLSLSRGAWLGAAAGTLALLAVLPAARQAVSRYVLPVAVAFAAWGTTQAGSAQLQVVVQRASTLTDRGANPYDNRDAIWAEGVREVRTRPVTGYGPGSFEVASSKSASGAASVAPVHAHNLWLTLGAEQGVVAALAALGLQLAVLRRGHRLRRLPPALAATHAGAFAAGVALVVHGVVDYPERNPTLFLVAWVVVGLCVAGAAKTDRQRRNVR
jgi:O-antigen ligase